MVTFCKLLESLVELVSRVEPKACRDTCRTFKAYQLILALTNYNIIHSRDVSKLLTSHAYSEILSKTSKETSSIEST